MSDFLALVAEAELVPADGVDWCLAVSVPNGDSWMVLCSVPFASTEFGDVDWVLWADGELSSIRSALPGMPVVVREWPVLGD